MLQLLLPGTAIVYNGDEVGMEDTFIRWDETVDPRAINAGPLKYIERSRDGCRTPFQWDNTENAGKRGTLSTVSGERGKQSVVLQVSLKVCTLGYP